VSLHAHLVRLSGVSWLTLGQRERVDRCIHIIALISNCERFVVNMFSTCTCVLVDRRGLIHFLRSNHGSSNETTGRSRRTSRSATFDCRTSTEYFIDKRDYSQDVEHKRVIDSFGVKRTSRSIQ
jgi:hypothetical protein